MASSLHRSWFRHALTTLLLGWLAVLMIGGSDAAASGADVDPAAGVAGLRSAKQATKKGQCGRKKRSATRSKSSARKCAKARKQAARRKRKQPPAQPLGSQSGPGAESPGVQAPPAGAPAAQSPSQSSAAPQSPELPITDPHGYYWGAWIDGHRNGGEKPPWDMAGVLDLERDVGKGMSLVHFGTPMAYANGKDYFAFPRNQFNTIRFRGSIPFFSWSTHAMGNFGHPDFTLRAVIEGRQDAHIRAWATAAKAWGHPFFLRFNWEMNGGWFPWGERYGSNQPGEFVAAWRHVHDIFTSVGATNANWVWCPTAEMGSTLQPLDGLYPGGDQVDWTCLDVYNGNNPWKSFSDVTASTYDKVTQLAPDKPMVIAEVGSTEAGGDKAAWIQSMFRSLPRRFPKVHGLVWFDYIEPGPGGKTDWMLDSSQAATAAFASGIADPAYQGNRHPQLTGSKIPIP